ncbi:MAG TPA: hypothetical protein GX513_04935 [Firmicutes bacterium]|nr:hypothetical protein [Bacillota bacterium]
MGRVIQNRYPLALAVVACLLLVLMAGGGCQWGRAGRGGQGPGADSGSGSPTGLEAAPDGVTVRTEGQTATVGLFPQALLPQWVNESKLLALVRSDGSESVVELSRGNDVGWACRILLTLKEGSTPDSFYEFDYLGEAESILFTSAPGGPLWRYDVPPPRQSGSQQSGSQQGRDSPANITEIVKNVVSFKVSPLRARAVVYRPGETDLVDFRSGTITRLPEVPSYEFPFVGHGSSWSPDDLHYLYQMVKGQLKPGFGIVRTDTGEIVRKVLPAHGCAFEAIWSPDGSCVAFLELNGRGDEFLGLDDELMPPVAQRLGILELKAGEVEYVSVPKKLIYGRPVWSPSGDAIAFAAGTVQSSKDRGFQANTSVYVTTRSDEGWKVTPLTRESEGFHQLPWSWSPGGKALALTSGREEPQWEYTFGVIVSSTGPDGGTSWAAPIMLGEVDERVVWLDDRTLVGLTTPAGSKRPQNDIRVFSVDGEVVSVLEAPPVHYAELVLSPGGHFLAYTVTAPVQEGSQETATSLKIRPLP